MEIEVGNGDRLDRHALVGAAGGPMTLLTDRPVGYPTGYVSLVLTEAPVPDLLARLCRFDERSRLATTGLGYMVDGGAQAEADELALDGDQPGAVEVLTAAGAPPAVARDWVAAVCTRRRAVAVSVTRNLGTVRTVRSRRASCAGW